MFAIKSLFTPMGWQFAMVSIHWECLDCSSLKMKKAEMLWQWLKKVVLSFLRSVFFRIFARQQQWSLFSGRRSDSAYLKYLYGLAGSKFYWQIDFDKLWFPWPLRYSDMNPLDFSFWGYMKEEIWKPSPSSIDEIKEKISEFWCPLTVRCWAA